MESMEKIDKSGDDKSGDDKSGDRRAAQQTSRVGLPRSRAVPLAAVLLLGAAYLHAIFGGRYGRYDGRGISGEGGVRHEALTAAITVGDVPMVWRLLDDGESAKTTVCSPYFKLPSGFWDGRAPTERLVCEPALTHAARFGNAAVAKLLISRGADVTARDPRGLTAQDVVTRLMRDCSGGIGSKGGMSGAADRGEDRGEDRAQAARCHRLAVVLRVLEQAAPPRLAPL
jgi:hypothetical protein